MRKFGRLWRGELALDNAFWGWAVLGGLAVNVATSAAFAFLIIAERPVVALLIGYGLSLPYNLVATVGVWRSADRYAGDRQWADLARIATVIGMIALSIT